MSDKIIELVGISKEFEGGTLAVSDFFQEGLKTSIEKMIEINKIK